MINKSDKHLLNKLEENLKDRLWRLNNLYWIRNAAGENVKFKLNYVQTVLVNNLWYLNVILKSRQHGCTTFFCILWLDEALFSGKTCAIVAHTSKNAEEIFDTKVQYAWDRLPDFIKKSFELDTNNAKMLKFKRGDKEGSIAVSTSVRSGTVQRLLITELGTLDQKYPEKSQEIKTGALNAVHKGQIVVIESTAKGQYGVFWDICKDAQNRQLKGEELSEMDYKFFFFPWYEQPTYLLEGDFVFPKELEEYFKSIESKLNIKLSKEQKNWYFKKKENQKEDMLQEFPSTPEEAFQANVEGAYYGRWIDDIRKEGRIRFLPYEPNLPVDTWWDLGVHDDTVIIFTQRIGMEVRIIDYYASHGEGLLHYAKVLKDKGYNYRTHNAPHDIEVREMTTGKSRKELAQSFGDGLAIFFNVIPKLSIEDGIEAVRSILPKCFFDEQRTTTLIQHLAEYRKEWDDKLGTWKSSPLHNYASHCLSGDTLIKTTQGDIPIKDLIGTKGLIYTPKGIREFINVRQTGENQKTYRVITDKGDIVGTDHHRVLTANGYKQIKELNSNDKIVWLSPYNLIQLEYNKLLSNTLWESKLYQILSKNLMVNDIIYMQKKNTIAKNTLADCTERFLNILMVKSLKGMLYITKMVIKTITKLRTLCCLADLSIIDYTKTQKKQEKEIAKTLKYTHSQKQSYGTSQNKAKSSTVLLEKNLGLTKNNMKKFVLCVIRNIKLIFLIVQNIVARNVKEEWGLVKKVVFEKQQDVYDLEVPEEHCFTLSNGLVVHNSADAFRLLAVGMRDLGNIDYEYESSFNKPTGNKETFDRFNSLPEL